MPENDNNQPENKQMNAKTPLSPTKIPTTPRGIQALAREKFKKQSKKDAASYKQGDAKDKVWDNYQITKELKREFKTLCKQNKIIASAYLRACVQILVNKLKKGEDANKALKAIKATDIDKLLE
jgi:hypothetical protein